MRSFLTDEFIIAFRALPPSVQNLARRQYRIWRVTPKHPGLHFKRVHPTEPLYSVRIGIGWRALGLLEDGSMTWFWIGSHADYDRLVRQFR